MEQAWTVAFETELTEIPPIMLGDSVGVAVAGEDTWRIDVVGDGDGRARTAVRARTEAPHLFGAAGEGDRLYWVEASGDSHVPGDDTTVVPVRWWLRTMLLPDGAPSTILQGEDLLGFAPHIAAADGRMVWRRSLELGGRRQQAGLYDAATGSMTPLRPPAVDLDEPALTRGHVLWAQTSDTPFTRRLWVSDLADPSAAPTSLGELDLTGVDRNTDRVLLDQGAALADLSARAGAPVAGVGPVTAPLQLGSDGIGLGALGDRFRALSFLEEGPTGLTVRALTPSAVPQQVSAHEVTHLSAEGDRLAWFETSSTPKGFTLSLARISVPG